jgi:beta-galactosidase
MTGKRISVEFDGVYMHSNVYANGQVLGNHPYAYTGFNYNLTGIVYTDGKTPNVIAVQAGRRLRTSRSAGRPRRTRRPRSPSTRCGHLQCGSR